MKGQPLDVDSNLKVLGKRLLKKRGLPQFQAVEVNYEMLCAEGDRLQHEQQMILDMKLSEDYFKNMNKGQTGPLICTGFGA